MARSLSVSTPISSATYRIGAACVSIRRLCAAREARPAFRVANTGFPVSLISEPRTGPALAFHGRQGGVRLSPPGGFLDREVDLIKPPVEVGDGVGGHLDPSRKGCVLRLDASASLGCDDLLPTNSPAADRAVTSWRGGSGRLNWRGPEISIR